MKKNLDNQNGFTFVLVIIVIAIVGVLVASYISSALFNMNFTEKQEDMSRAYFAAQSGIENLKGEISSKIEDVNNNDLEAGDIIYEDEIIEYGEIDASYEVKFIDLTGVVYVFESLGRYNNSEKKIRFAADLAGGLKGVNVNDPNGIGDELIDLTAGGIEDYISLADLKDVIDFGYDDSVNLDEKTPEELFYKMLSNFNSDVFTGENVYEKDVGDGDKDKDGNDDDDGDGMEEFTKYNLYNAFYDSTANEDDDGYTSHDYSEVDFENDVVFIDGSWKFNEAEINNSIVFVKNNVHFTGNTTFDNSILIIFDSEGDDNSQGSAKTNIDDAFKASGPPSYSFTPDAGIFELLYGSDETDPTLKNSTIWYGSK